MPYPAQVTSERILDRAVHLIETHDAAQLSLHQLAADLGIRTPSLYRYFANRAELLRAVNLRTAEGLIAAMRESAAQPLHSHSERVVEMGIAYRRYAHAHPRSYLLAFGTSDAALRPDEAALAALAEQIQAVIAPLATSTDSLTVLRGLWALVHGFVSLELTDQIRRGGDLSAAFRAALEIFARGLTG